MYEMIDRYIRSLIQKSSPDYTAWNMERVREGKPANWNYIDGCMLTSLLSMSEITGEKQYADFVERFVDAFIGEDGSIRTYQPEKFNLDDINEGRALIPIWQRTQKEKFRLAADRLKAQLNAQPRTQEGNFWHKKIYPNQVWLDGIYMAQPFAALYEKTFGQHDYTDIVQQIQNVRAKMFDPEKGLYYHGYDASRKAFWADPVTGRSKSFWLRSIGWFATALADLYEIVDDAGAKEKLGAILAELAEGISRYADPETGMYAQVVDQPEREGNYLETSGSCMIAYAMLKGARLGVLPKSFATLGKKTFDGIVRTKLTTDGESIDLDGICLVAGLGPENNPRRDGTFAYYISEPVVKNDAKGVAPFVMCYTEVIRLTDPA
ncbi:MAG: glycoside hydrolase family 88 protein [Clostridia bacterium]|nr:glycoside hydrolase family 88 protein [Clostridia bacterium]